MTPDPGHGHGPAWTRLVARFKGSNDSQAAQIFAGNAVAQGMTILVAPLLTRLFSPSEYGTLGAYTAAVGIFGTLTSLRYEMAFARVQSDEEAYHLMALCGLVVLLCTVVAMAGLALWRGMGGVDPAWLRDYWWAVPIGMMCYAAYNSLVAEATRARRYGLIAVTRVWQGIGSAAMQVSAGLLSTGAIGLLAGYVIGQSGGIFRFLRQMVLPHPGRRPLRLADLRAVARRYRTLAIFSSGSGVLDAAGGGYLLPLLLASLYGIEVVGYVFLAERVVGRPLMMTANSLLPVYVGEVTRLRATQPQRIVEVFRATLTRQSLICCAWAAIVVLSAPYVVQPIFGEGWGRAVPIIQALAIAYVPQSILQSVTHTLPMFARYQIAAAWSVSRVAVLVGVVVLLHRQDASPLTVIVGYAIEEIVSHIVLFFIMWRTVRRESRSPARSS